VDCRGRGVGCGAVTQIPDVERSLAATLFDTVKALQQHINERAEEVAAPRIEEAERHCRETVDSLTRSQTAEVQRLSDLIAELRRQLEFCDRRAERYAGWLRAAGINPLTGLGEEKS
jgi:hypothetical protein